MPCCVLLTVAGLQHLGLSNNTHVTDTALSQVASRLQELRTLELRHTGVTESGVMLLQQLPQRLPLAASPLARQQPPQDSQWPESPVTRLDALAAAFPRASGRVEQRSELSPPRLLQRQHSGSQVTETQAPSLAHKSPAGSQHAAQHNGSPLECEPQAVLEAAEPATTLSLAEFIDRVGVRSHPATTARLLAKLVLGPDFAQHAEAIQVAELSKHWDEMEAHVQQRVDGKAQDEAVLSPFTACNYARAYMVCLRQPEVQAELGKQQLQCLL